MTHFKYITDHLLRAWVQSWTYNFRIWADLMTNNYEEYALLKDDDPYQECYEWFWSSINIDDTLPKEFLEGLYRMVEDIDTGIVKTIPADDVFNRINGLVNDDEEHQRRAIETLYADIDCDFADHLDSESDWVKQYRKQDVQSEAETSSDGVLWRAKCNGYV